MTSAEGAGAERGSKLARKFRELLPRELDPRNAPPSPPKYPLGFPASLALSLRWSVPFPFLSFFFFPKKVFCFYANTLKTKMSKPSPLAFLMKSSMSDRANYQTLTTMNPNNPILSPRTPCPRSPLCTAVLRQRLDSRLRKALGGPGRVRRAALTQRTQILLEILVGQHLPVPGKVDRHFWGQPGPDGD